MRLWRSWRDRGRKGAVRQVRYQESVRESQGELTIKGIKSRGGIPGSACGMAMDTGGEKAGVELKEGRWEFRQVCRLWW